MELDLEHYRDSHICVAVSGGKDSMTLLHALCAAAPSYGVKVFAMNCDHRIRPTSADDSAFVAKYCEERGIRCFSYAYDGVEPFRGEEAAREWRLTCYLDAQNRMCASFACIATAHHLEDNAETLLFNLARGSGLNGARGIHDDRVPVYGTDDEGRRKSLGVVNLIRPIIEWSQKDIDEYVSAHNIPYVEDETNSTDRYTRNKIRHGVLPALEEAVPGAAAALLRFTSIVNSTENDLSFDAQRLVSDTPGGYTIDLCRNRTLFTRAAIIVFERLRIKDYTMTTLYLLYGLQNFEVGKTFRFSGLCAYKEKNRLAICREEARDCEDVPFMLAVGQKSYYNELCYIKPWRKSYRLESVEADVRGEVDPFPDSILELRFDMDQIPDGAVVRFMREGDVFTKFGGGTKNLAAYFTNKKIPLRLRKRIPLVAEGNRVLIVGGVEISDYVSITPETVNPYSIICCDYKNI